jgi:hypothetical protein
MAAMEKIKKSLVQNFQYGKNAFLQSAWLSEVTLTLRSYFVLLTDRLSGISRA